MRLTDDVYGPGPTPGSRILLASKNVDYEEGDLARIAAAAEVQGMSDEEIVAASAAAAELPGDHPAHDPEGGTMPDPDDEGDPDDEDDEDADGDDEGDEPDTPEVSREDLEARAEALGIPVQANWKDETVAAKIAEAEATDQDADED